MAAFAAQVESAGYGLAHTPMFEDVRVFRRGIGEDSDVVGKEMYEFEDRGGRALALRPEGTAPMVRAFVQHRPPLPWKAWYVTPAFRYERPQAGRYRQHHQLGVEALGHRRPRSRRRGDRPGRRLLPLARAGRVRPAAQLDGGRGLPARPTSTLLRAYLAERADRAVRRAPRAARGQPAAGPRLQAAGVPGGDRRRPAPRRPPLRALRRPLRPGARRPRRRSGCPTELDHRLVRGFDYYTRTTFEFASAGAGRRPRTGSAGAAATTAWSRCWAARRPRASASASASSASCWPVTPRACSRSSPDPARRLRGRRDRRGRRPGTSPPSCAGPACGPTGPSTAARSSPS